MKVIIEREELKAEEEKKFPKRRKMMVNHRSRSAGTKKILGQFFKMAVQFPAAAQFLRQKISTTAGLWPLALSEEDLKGPPGRRKVASRKNVLRGFQRRGEE